ncbi:MAG TPA: bifunctional nicotinamidase/pyrazinamidase [Thermoanaerobaculia bacterium]|nr:bifunctional nicotinamidase/pyrazinamidase [Thermoanaerobaculia bacterium]
MKSALVLVDLQYDFMPGGALAVSVGDRVVPVANELSAHFDLVVATQDWHPRDHGSFASNHAGKKPGDMIELGGVPQVLWPDHCVQGSPGAELHRDFDRRRVKQIFRKGTDREIDSYSGFYDNGHRKATGMGEFLKSEGVTDVYIAGLATDYCVKFTALDGIRLGFRVHVIEDGCRGVNLSPGDSVRAIEELRGAGVEILQSEILARV